MACEVRVYLPSLLEAAAGGRRELTLAADTLSECIETLLAEVPRLRVHLFDEKGELREHVNLFYNDTNARWLESWDVQLAEGDSLTVVQAVSGG